jgi:hypothetical protein
MSVFMRVLVIVVIIGALSSTAALRAQSAAQSVDLSGTWSLDRAASRIVREAGLTGLGASGAPDTLHITHAANGSIVIGSEINESQSRLYRIGGTSSLPLADGSLLPISSRVEGRSVVVEGGGAAGALKEVLTLSADGQGLTIAITASGAGASHTTTMLYKRQQSAGPCERWPTPCQSPEGSAERGRRGAR